ncbi:hydantoinase/oxoprolinase family protein [Saliphagus sp. GCM10025308]
MPHIGVDIGGTFTDTVLVDGDAVHTVKTPTTEDLVCGVVAGVDATTTRAGIEPETIESFNHGSTVAVNTLIEGTGAKTAIVTSDGFRDVFEIGEAYRDASLLYDPRGEHHPPLVRRRFRFEVTERTAADGSIVTPLNEDAVADVAAALRERDVESAAVCFLHAYANPKHERRAREILADHAPEIDVSLSTDVSPEIREYTRTATTAADAYVKPAVSTYLSRLVDALGTAGVEGTINIMKSDGGLAQPTVASRRPITQVISGPVAGVKASQSVAATADLGDVITFDMGGTSADVALIKDGAPVEESRRMVRGLKINGPFVNINTVGAGGGSIAWLNDVNALKVGPRSAGARPGPACYRRGGTEPTVTDANLVLGVLNPSNFAGGEVALDVDAARESLSTVAEQLSMSVNETAVAVREVIDSKLASAIRVVTVQEGNDPREFALMAFGGAGPAHACDIATGSVSTG